MAAVTSSALSSAVHAALLLLVSSGDAQECGLPLQTTRGAVSAIFRIFITACATGVGDESTFASQLK